MKNKLFALLSLLLSVNTSFSQDVQTMKVEEMFTAFNEYCPIQVGELFYIDKVIFENKNLYYSLSERKPGIFNTDSSVVKDIAYEVLGHMGAPSIFLLAAGYGIIIDLNKGDKTERITILPDELKEKVTEASHRVPVLDMPEIYPSLESYIKEINSSCPSKLTEEMEMTSIKLDSAMTVEISVLEQGTENTKLDDIKNLWRDYQYRVLGYISGITEENEQSKYVFEKIREKNILMNLIFRGSNTGRVVEMKIPASSLIILDVQKN
ncbi:MAG: hypothetical protein IKH89_01770 [Bacteroidales bacterium]|nr:hypothetical protein [Bacteroidales bacterium]MBR6971462.1 hypothetical protein [Bacteroidales bacterium]